MEAARAKGAAIAYGMFLQNVIEFFIVAFTIFLIVRQINKTEPRRPPRADGGAQIHRGGRRDRRGGLALATTGRRIATTSVGSVVLAAAPAAAPAPPTPLQTGLWRDVTEAGLNIAQTARRIVPDRYRTVALDAAVLRDVLSRAPLEFTPAAAGTATFLELPWPDGGARTFRIDESPIMAPALAAQYPALRTYSGQGVDDPTASLRFDWTPQGFHAMVLSADGTVYVDPYSPGNITNYISYYKRDYRRPAGQTFTCGVTDTALGVADRQYAGPYQPSHGTTLHARLALAAG